MFVCVCMAITESEVRTVIARGATTREEVTRLCRAGGDCGSCHGMIDDMLEDHRERGGCEGERVFPAPHLVRRPARAA